MLLQQNINNKDLKSESVDQINDAQDGNTCEVSNSRVDLVVGDVVVGNVKAICKSYATITVDGYDFILPVEELSWRTKNSLKNVLSIGMPIEAVVVAFSEAGQVMLSVKRLRSDPWLNIQQRYSAGIEVEGVVSRIFPFGVIVRLEQDVEGMLHQSEMPQSLLPVEEHFKLGEKIKVRLLGIIPAERKMSFTIN